MNRITQYLGSYSKFDWKTIGNGHAVPVLLDCFKSRLVDGTNTEQYITLGFYRKSQRERNLFVTNGKTVKLEKISRRGATKEELSTLQNKRLFVKKYAKYVKRGSLPTKDASAQEIAAFIEKHGRVLIKPAAETQGRGIEAADYSPDTVMQLAEKLAGKDFLVEQFIKQHPVISAVNPSSVNTIRICTVLDDSHKAHVIGAALRSGGKDSVVDNFHHGGVAYPIDIENGVICGSGRTNSDNKTYARHPATDTLMIGLKIPNWDTVMNSVVEAAEMSDRIAYIGWDVAITEEGVDIIEANIGQGCTMWQLDNVGKYPEICRLMRK